MCRANVLPSYCLLGTYNSNFEGGSLIWLPPFYGWEGQIIKIFMWLLGNGEVYKEFSSHFDSKVVLLTTSPLHNDGNKEDDWVYGNQNIEVIAQIYIWFTSETYNVLYIIHVYVCIIDINRGWERAAHCLIIFLLTLLPNWLRILIRNKHCVSIDLKLFSFLSHGYL